MQEALAYIVTAVLGGGLFKGLEALYRAVTDAREKKTLADSIGAKTPVEIESVSVATMTSALESSQRRIEAIEKERESDRKYYTSRISDLETERETDRDYYQARIIELTDQLAHVRAELMSVERKLVAFLEDTGNKIHSDPIEEGGLSG